MKTIAVMVALLTGTFIAVTNQPTQETEGGALNDRGSSNAHVARYTDDGQLIRPLGWRKWIYVGTPLTPHDMNDGKAAFPEFHNVYIDPESFATFERTGEFPNGTQLVKELALVGSKKAVSGNGYFMGDFAGLEVAIKDTVRFKDEPGGWAYFSFGHKAEYEKTAKAFPAASCNACHAASADTDFVFTQYYPVLLEAMPTEKRKMMESNKQSSKKMDDAAMKAAMAAMGGDAEGTSADAYSEKVFKWLAAKNYQNFRSESAVHPSSAGPAVHGDVKIFVNDKLDASMKAGNKSHPVGSMSVKELYKDGNHIGWALALKSKEDDGKGNGWYWYENLSLTDSSKPIAASLGNVNCVGCHAPGNDFIRINEIK
jgi:mono/diheme cytochrome c family protein